MFFSVIVTSDFMASYHIWFEEVDSLYCPHPHHTKVTLQLLDLLSSWPMHLHYAMHTDTANKNNHLPAGLALCCCTLDVTLYGLLTTTMTHDAIQAMYRRRR